MTTKKICVLSLTNGDTTTKHDIVLENTGDRIFTRIRPEIEDKRIDTEIGQITGDAYLEFVYSKKDDGCMEETKDYIVRRVNHKCENDELFKSHKAELVVID